MTAFSRKFMRAALYGLIGAYVLLFVVAGWAGYGLLLDTRMPLSDMHGRLVSLDLESRSATIEWTAIRQRFCEGVSKRQIRDGVVLDLEGASITMTGGPDDRREQALYPQSSGYTISWRTVVGIPEIVRGVATYSVRLQYWCNPWQRLFPLELIPTPVDIPIGEPYDVGMTEMG